MPSELFPCRVIIPVLCLACVLAASGAGSAPPVLLPEQQIVLNPGMVTSLGGKGSMDTFIDEQEAGKNPAMSSSKTMWDLRDAHKGDYPVEFIVDLGAEHHISNILFWDSNGHGVIRVHAGDKKNWREILMEDGVGINTWKYHNDLNARTRYLRVVKEEPGGAFGEMLVYEYTPEAAKAAVKKGEMLDREKQMMEAAQKDTSIRPQVETGTLFGKLPLVDEINAGEEPGGRTFLEHPQGASKVATILGTKNRVIPNEQKEASYFAYRVGEGKLLQPGKAYLLTVEFPEDEPRTFSIINRGGDLVRGIQTGQSLGDSIFGYTSTNLESLNIPLSKKVEVFQQLFWLNDKYADVQAKRGDDSERSFSPVRGFPVIVAQWPSRQTPISKGAAVSRIRLFEVPDPEKFNVALRLPPEGLPQRHLFYREEMGDGAINHKDPAQRAVANLPDWYEYHFRNMNFLGMNTFAKDLLEFGAPQGWDVENGAWYNQSKFPDLWGKIVPLAAKHGLSILPYYEYAGSSGRMGLGIRGPELAQPLSGKGDYTHIKWAENKRVDLTSPEVLEEFKRVLDLTIVKFKDDAKFLGAWIRPRVSQMPISFSDPTRERFATEANGGTAVSRADLKGDPELLQRYYAWWNNRRKAFLIAVRDYLKEKQVNPDPLVLFMAYHAEPAPAFPKIKQSQIPLVTDETAIWNGIAGSGVKDYDRFLVLSEAEVRDQNLYLAALTAPPRTWDAWEWHHAAPRPDPLNYKDTPGVLMTYPFNRMFTVNEPEAFELFRGQSGLAMIRHYPLNENTMDDLLGYFVTDVDRTGPYGMLSEALAVANGDPWNIGYTSSFIYNRPFPDAVRRFNANFLALPALPSKILEKAASDQEVVVRQIDAGKSGAYYAIVNTGMTGKKNVTVRLPKAGRIVEAATGTVLAENAMSATIALEPYELRSLQVQ